MSFENICILLFTLSLIFTLKFSHQTTKVFVANKTNLKPKIQEDLHEIHFSGSWHISDKWRRVNVSLWDLQAAIHQTLQSTIDDNHCRVNVAQLTIHHYTCANKLWNTRSWDMCLSYIGVIHFRLSKKSWDFVPTRWEESLSQYQLFQIPICHPPSRMSPASGRTGVYEWEAFTLCHL